jgi:hypothetical protein
MNFARDYGAGAAGVAAIWAISAIVATDWNVWVKAVAVIIAACFLVVSLLYAAVNLIAEGDQ